ncbi:response regulator [Candidatus Omnitrophota bacterium]
MKKVLIVDDEEDFLFFLKKNLEKDSGLAIRICSDARLALKTACEFVPDLIFLDILMPEISGPELARDLKKQEQTAKTPIVFLTALSPPEALDNIGEQIPDPLIITKPISMSSLILMIEKLLA